MDFTLDIDSGYKDAAHMQNDLQILFIGRLFDSYLIVDKIVFKLL